MLDITSIPPAAAQSADTLVMLLEQRADLTPGDTPYIFLADGDGEVRITYAELREKAKRIAVFLKDRRVTAGCPVLLIFHPGLDYICAFFGCLYAGAIPVPAYPPTHARHLRRLQSVIDDAGTDFALTTAKELGAIHALAKKDKGLSIQGWLILDDVQTSSADWADPGLDASQIALLQYTSGSTSTPKGVMVSHGNVLAHIRHIASAIEATPSDVLVFWLPPYHDFGLVGGILFPLVIGTPCILMRPASFLLNPYRWLKAISRYRATITGAPNFAYDLCARAISAEQRASLDLSCLRVAFNGAEPIRAGTLDKFSEVFGPCGFRPEAWLAAYGLAEATLMVSGRRNLASQPLPRQAIFSKAALQDNRARIAAPDEDGLTLVSTGTVLQEHHVAIVDPHTLQRCEEGHAGEIWVSGPSVAKGYWKRPEETEQAFFAQIAGSPGERYMRTGDLGFVHKEGLYICGRHKDLIIVNGVNIYPQDVELASFESHPSLRQDGAIAFALEHNDGEQLVIVQELDFRKKSDDALFGGIASAVLNSIGIPPDVILLVKAGQLPRTSSGKLRRRQCKQDLEGGNLAVLSRWDRPRADQTLQAPARLSSDANALTKRLAIRGVAIETWLRTELASRLGVDAQTIDRDQPFAFYGLNSMAAVQLAEAISERLRHPIAPIVFFDHPTLAQLAEALAEASGEASDLAIGALAKPAEPIAVIGLGCRFPGANGAKEFWDLLIQGRDAVGDAPAARYGAQTFSVTATSAPHTRLGGFLDQVDRFDAHFFNVSPLEAERMDPQQRLALETAWEALEDAGIPASRLAGSAAGVFIGVSTHDYDRIQGYAPNGLSIYSATGSAGSIVANRLSYFLDLRGPSLAVDTACSSSLVAVHMACQSLRNGESSVAIAGGVNLILSAESSAPFAQAGMLAPDGRSKAFDASANGYVRGEGCGVIILKKLDDAIRGGDRVRAVILGSAVAQDGRSNGLIAPNGSAQVAVIRQALAQARVTPAQVSYVEAHGTGTALGDPIELNALKSVFPKDAAAPQCFVGSVKTNIGHLEAAAGVAGLIKTVLALEHGAIPANLHYRTLNPHCSLAETRLEIPAQKEPWGGDESRYAGVSSFGFGGTIAHMIVAQGRPAGESGPEWPSHLLTFSAKTGAALEAMTDELAAQLEASADLALADVAYTHQLGRQAFGARRMLVCRDRGEAIDALRSRDPQHLLTAQIKNHTSRIVFMFPGQGAQKLRMARELYREAEAFRGTLDTCAEILRRHAAFDLLDLIYPEGKAGEDNQRILNQTEAGQPALFAIEYALARLWMSWGVQPSAMIGHSVGEDAAACLAGVFSLEDALLLVAARARLMQALPPGAMLSVALNEEQLLDHLGDSVSLAAVNGPGRCVVSGTEAAIGNIGQRLEGLGIACRRVSTSHAFHSHMMEPMLSDFAAQLSAVKLSAPAIPFISSVTGTWISAQDATDRDYWVRHLHAPVRFSAGLASLASDPEQFLIEVGPGQTLCALARLHKNSTAGVAWDILPSLSHHDALPEDLAVLLGTAGRLWLAGHPVDWKAVYAGQRRRFVSLLPYPLQRERYWIERSVSTATLINATSGQASSNATQKEPPKQ